MKKLALVFLSVLVVRPNLNIFCLVLVLSYGCSTVTVRPVSVSAPIKHVCIEDGSQMCFDGQLIGVIRDGFERHGITSEIYSGKAPANCKYTLAYMCERTWDFSTFMRHAEIRLYQDLSQIGYAEYHLPGKGGLDFSKWENTKSKMDPLIDRMLGGQGQPQTKKD
jgi:hypothetical protein